MNSMTKVNGHHAQSDINSVKSFFSAVFTFAVIVSMVVNPLVPRFAIGEVNLAICSGAFQVQNTTLAQLSTLQSLSVKLMKYILAGNTGTTETSAAGKKDRSSQQDTKHSSQSGTEHLFAPQEKRLDKNDVTTGSVFIVVQELFYLHSVFDSFSAAGRRSLPCPVPIVFIIAMLMPLLPRSAIARNLLSVRVTINPASPMGAGFFYLIINNSFKEKVS